MKALLRVTVVLTVIALTLGTLGSTGMFFYWRISIHRALREWEKEAFPLHGFNEYRRQSGAPPRVSRVLEQAGCRAIPYLVQALEGPGKPAFKECLVDRILQCLAGPVLRGKEAVRFYNEHYDLWAIDLHDSPDEREVKIRRVVAWWHDHRHEFHQEWRLWSPLCRPWPRP